MTDELRVASWNIEKNGRGRNGTGDHRSLARKIVRSFRPHIYYRQELTGAWANGKADLYDEAREIGGLMPFMTQPREGRSLNPVGVMIDPDEFEMLRQYEHDLPWKPICHLTVRPKGSDTQLHLASAHLCHFDPDMRATEARRLTTLADHGHRVIIGMDGNSYPHQRALETVALPDWTQVQDRVHYQHRTVPGPNGERVSDTRPHEILTGNGIYVDLGLHASTVLGQPGALAPTASLKRLDQGPPQRIDWILSTPDIAQGLIRFEVVATEDVKRVSDHPLLIAVFDLATVCEPAPR
ncbi:endonuclease/exonuclease/phosphatase family protein [Streptomyces sp. CSDS2]|uniref:Endonuclease/exonuclease/phosphatase family protein n=1 Tax=Streptomyces lavenduligriseus TaxID=67315 RepID=A0ABT0P584_9ACTN|nr:MULTISPECIES: endonuclease/exonuclease/phosphatase family protein [Streptomyces]MCL3998877.1 endonuclease/exonuclease/phosphatase family protein [Streptomyces lavenduligriseus]MDN3260815.1 endonuclease/exonuclease/phosphatase family protein [Streptomyces sp. CSDS2]